MRVAGGHFVATAMPGTAPECSAREDVRSLEPEGEKETQETRVVSDGVEGVSVEAGTLPRERVRQLTAEQVEDTPLDRPANWKCAS